jgi:prepilin-type N-terminal cleavage/methylation domain-containing protein
MRFNMGANCRLRNADCGPSPFPTPHWGEGVVKGTLHCAGITFIEVIVVMMIIGILAAIVVPKLGLPTTTSTASVGGAAYMVASDIRYAQEFAMANRVSKSVIFSTATPTVYTFSPTNTLDSSGRLPSGVTINNNYTVTFNSLGEPTTGGAGSVTVIGGGLTKTIGVVNYTGKVNIT